MIPQVVASERGLAQTCELLFMGVVGLAKDLINELECVGKHNRRG